ncbi:hypothetical protein PVL29_003418 [Vitis rotundifolia]|uniref:MADS-box domain-containing protein n=1 Tax=Vitis rotundifolia TaxID=103349 RepID=A0AA39AD33_VITRO|nr:hypothetical protein PVL29_003418 [Vitis rotundifolia]
MAPMRKSKGRQKFEMTKMTKESNLQKACELCTLCGAKIVMIVFSLGKKVYSFGQPSIESIIDYANVRDLNMQLTQVLNQLECEMRHGEALIVMREANQAWYRWLKFLKLLLENLKKNVAMHADKHMMEALNLATFFSFETKEILFIVISLYYF